RAPEPTPCRRPPGPPARPGLPRRLPLPTSAPAPPPATDGNILLDRLVGAEIVWVTPDEYAERNELFARMSTELAGAGRRPYVIPEGGSNPLGAWGYVRAFEELAADLAGLGPARRTSIVYACGSGGTGAGLLVGARLLDADVRIVGVNVCDDRAHFIRVIGGVVEEMIRNHALAIPFERDLDLEIVDGYVGKGYAESRPEELALIAELARTQGIARDPGFS